MLMARTLCLFVLTALAEILGCYLPSNDGTARPAAHDICGAASPS